MKKPVLEKPISPEEMMDSIESIDATAQKQPDLAGLEPKQEVNTQKVPILTSSTIEKPIEPPKMDKLTSLHKPQQAKKIGQEEIDKALKVFEMYKVGKSNLESRVIENEQWWKMRHWEQLRGQGKEGNAIVDPASAWLFNSVSNKHADAMDNYPEPSILPREESDKKDATTLSSILPVILEQNEYEQTYSDTWWDKIKNGTGVKGVFWNSSKLNGLGDIEIKQIDLLNIFWEPGITKIQDSANVFTVELVDNDFLTSKYPVLKNKLSTETVNVAKYQHDDTINTDNKSYVIDWYYKSVNPQGKQVVHYCKFCNGVLLYASENENEYADRGFYDHGKYPFVFDTLFVEKGTPCGFGYIDIMKDAQLYIDKLNAVILENALLMSKPRFFIKSTGSVNEKEFLDISNPLVHVNGSVTDENIKPIVTNQLPGIVPSILQQKIEELKETSGNRDFSQGGTSSGVTAASAIAALQEAGSKLSRDMIKNAYRAFTQECYLVLELIRQFYDEPRCFRITGNQGDEQFIDYSNNGIKLQSSQLDFSGEETSRLPVFDIKIRSQKSSPFSKISQNELAKEFYGMGFFNPQNADQSLACIEMMDFEGKQGIIQKVSQNGMMYQQMQQMQMQLQQMAQIVEQVTGQNPLGGEQGAMPGGTVRTEMPSNANGENSIVDRAKERTAGASSPK